MTTRSKSLITKEYLLDLFESEQTYIIEPIILKKSQIIQKPNTSVYEFSPHTRTLLQSFTPNTRRYMIDDLRNDDEDIYKIEQALEEKDEVYTYFENTAIGVFLEEWVCYNLKCSCGDKFVKYQNPNMPVIDIKCNNDNHNSDLYGPKYYQIKSSELYKTFRGLEYFQLEPNQYIHVGSRKYGSLCHEIKIGDIDFSNKSSDKYKKLLIGYICIKYTYNTDSNINIIGNSSFILQPKLKFDKFIDLNSQYYLYPIVERNVITFNKDLFNIYLFENIQSLNLKNISIMQFEKINNIKPMRLF